VPNLNPSAAFPVLHQDLALSVCIIANVKPSFRDDFALYDSAADNDDDSENPALEDQSDSDWENEGVPLMEPVYDGFDWEFDDEPDHNEELPADDGDWDDSDDEPGVIRVRQKRKVYPLVFTAPFKKARANIRNCIGHTFSRESTLLDKDLGIRNGVTSDLLASLIPTSGPQDSPQGNDRIFTLCDYTGLYTSQTMGPFRASIETALSYVLFADMKGNVVYHGSPNVYNVIVFLNWVKQLHPILVLPLLGQFMRIEQEPVDFQTRKALWIGTYMSTTMQNVTTMGLLFGCNLRHKGPIKEWQQWGWDRLETVLEHLRTGKLGQAIQSRRAP
jgi:hypothetical protein